MSGGMKVLGGVRAGRLVTAADVTTGEAKSEVDPAGARLEALFASLGCACRDRANLGDVNTGVGHKARFRILGQL
jgi:hypothetical protein